MEMEHVNENTIRVLIGNEDLAERGVTFLDLLGNHREIENFFYSILEEVDVNHEFRGSEAVTFQVLPKKDGLELFISKNLTPEDLNQIEEINQVSPNEIESFIREQVLNETVEEEKGPLSRVMVFKFNDFENLIQFANDTYLDEVWTDLYLFNDSYYLQVFFASEEATDNQLTMMIAEILEFGERTPVTPEILAEHGKCLMTRDAIESLRYYFH